MYSLCMQSNFFTRCVHDMTIQLGKKQCFFIDNEIRYSYLDHILNKRLNQQSKFNCLLPFFTMGIIILFMKQHS